MLKTAYIICKRAVLEFIEDGCMQMSAALAYYTIFALPGLLIILIFVAGIVFETQSVEEEVIRQVRSLLGQDSANTVRIVINNVLNQTSNVSVAAMVGLGVILFGATGAFAELQSALNAIWGVKPDPQRGDLRLFIRKRILSFGLILSIGFLLLVSLLFSTLLSIISQQVDTLLPDLLSSTFLQGAEFFISYIVITALFAAIFKILPDAKVLWRDVFAGAIVTAFVFVIGKELFGLYVGNGSIGSAYGAASSLAVLLVWVYFSAVITFFGAELTLSWLIHSGRKIKPAVGAELV